MDLQFTPDHEGFRRGLRERLAGCLGMDGLPERSGRGAPPIEKAIDTGETYQAAPLPSPDLLFPAGI